MGWIIVLLAGAFIGWIASMIMGTNASMGAIANVVVGLVGAVIGRFVAGLIGLAPPGTNFSLMGLIFGIIGSCILIGILKLVMGGKKSAV